MNVYDPHEMSLCSFHVFACTCIDSDHVALVDEEGNLDLSACFKSSRLGSVGSSIALEAGVGLCYLELNKVGRLYSENLALVGTYLAHHLLLDKLEVVGKLSGADRLLLIGLRVHKVVKVTVVVGIFHIPSLNISGGELSGRVVALFNYGACNNVLDLGSYESSALSGFTCWNSTI